LKFKRLDSEDGDCYYYNEKLAGAGFADAECQRAGEGGMSDNTVVQEDTSWCGKYRTCVGSLLAIGGGLVVAVLLGFILWNVGLHHVTAGPELKLPLIVVLSVVVLLIVLGLLTFSFLNVGARKPERSTRPA